MSGFVIKTVHGARGTSKVNTRKEVTATSTRGTIRVSQTTLEAMGMTEGDRMGLLETENNSLYIFKSSDTKTSGKIGAVEGNSAPTFSNVGMWDAIRDHAYREYQAEGAGEVVEADSAATHNIVYQLADAEQDEDAVVDHEGGFYYKLDFVKSAPKANRGSKSDAMEGAEEAGANLPEGEVPEGDE